MKRLDVPAHAQDAVASEEREEAVLDVEEAHLEVLEEQLLNTSFITTKLLYHST